LLNPVLKLLKRDYDYEDPEQVVINTIEGGFIKIMKKYQKKRHIVALFLCFIS